jgi:hypothetical protein
VLRITVHRLEKSCNCCVTVFFRSGLLGRCIVPICNMWVLSRELLKIRVLLSYMRAECWLLSLSSFKTNIPRGVWLDLSFCKSSLLCFQSLWKLTDSLHLCSTNPRATICLFCVPVASEKQEFCMRKSFLQFMYRVVSTRTCEVNCRIVYLCVTKHECDYEIGLLASALDWRWLLCTAHFMFKGVYNSVTVQLVLFLR